MVREDSWLRREREREGKKEKREKVGPPRNLFHAMVCLSITFVSFRLVTLCCCAGTGIISSCISLLL